MSNTKTDRPVEAWGLEGDEELSFSDLDELIEDWISNIAWPDRVEDLPETIDVIGYARMQLSAADVRPLCEYALKQLDDEYGDPMSSDCTVPTAAMLEAEQRLAEVIIADYEPWAMVDVERRTVNVREWIAEHAPDYAADCETNRAQRVREGIRGER